MKLTLLTDPTTREFDAVDRFAAALGASVIEGGLADAPVDGYVVVFGPEGLADHPALWPRVVLINADRANAVAEVERMGLAAAVEENRYFRWRAQPDGERGSGVIGRKDIARALGAKCLAETEHHAWITSDQHADLPSLLLAYLEAREC